VRLPAGYVWDIPLECGEARGSEADYRADGNTCWYSMTKFRTLYPEYRDLGDDDLARRLYQKAGTPLPTGHPWQMLGEKAVLAVGPPIGLVAVGWAVLWALAGFTVRKDLRGAGKG
jgi:hypothetical protein